MPAKAIFSDAPIGATIAWSDGTPRPPERHRNKLSAWKGNNSQGRLIARQAERMVGSVTLPASFTLHEADFGASGVTVLRVNRTFSVGSALTFTILECPAPSSVRIFDRPGDGAELVHLAANRIAAEEWLSRHGYPSAVLDEVMEAEAQDPVLKQGRAA
jgi:hypothetical protein